MILKSWSKVGQKLVNKIRFFTTLTFSTQLLDYREEYVGSTDYGRQIRHICRFLVVDKRVDLDSDSLNV